MSRVLGYAIPSLFAFVEMFLSPTLLVCSTLNSLPRP